MMVKKVLFLAFMLMSLSRSVRAQFSVEEAAVLAESKAYFDVGDNLSTRELLSPLAKMYPMHPDINYLMGAASFALTVYHVDAFSYLESAALAGKEESYELYIKCLMEQYYLRQAQEFILEKNIQHHAPYTNLMHQIENAQNAIKNEAACVVESLGEHINSVYTEHTPLISADDSALYFTSRRPRSSNTLKDLNGEFDENIFYTQRVGEKWSEPKEIEGNINDILNEATVALVADEMVVFKTTRNLESSDLWIASLTSNGEWKLKSKLSPSLNSKWVEGGFASNTNGDVFIISSDRPGGFGGMDLYRIMRFGNGDFSEPQNLGSNINTGFDETSPHLLLDDRTLYFASNRPESMGGFDVFKTTFSGDTNFGVIENIGYPLNTTRDDLHLNVSSQTGRVYFTRSKEEHSADYDIYSSNLPGFNLKATIYKYQVIGNNTSNFNDAEVVLLKNNYSKTLGRYRINEDGLFTVVLLPNESGILKINVPDYELQEHYITYVDAVQLSEIDKELILVPKKS